MNSIARALIGSVYLAALGSAAWATPVRVQVTGVVDYNVIQGGMAGLGAGTPVTMSFRVDSNNFVNSASFPTRGYHIDLSSFTLTVGPTVLTLVNPLSSGDALFVLRDNDPAVDGFFISRGTDLPFPLDMRVPGLAAVHEFDFSRSFSVGTALTSVNILDAVGTYGLENIGSYQWTVGRFGNPGAEFVYQSMTITAVPEPASWAMLGAGGLLLLLRRRVQAMPVMQLRCLAS